MSCGPPAVYAKSFKDIPNSIDFTPTVITDHRGLLLERPEEIYVARIGRNKLYFQDTTIEEEEAKMRKIQLDGLNGPLNCRLELDVDTFSAKWVDPKTREVFFEFSQRAAKAYFASGFNRVAGKQILEEKEGKHYRVVKYSAIELTELMAKQEAAAQRKN